MNSVRRARLRSLFATLLIAGWLLTAPGAGVAAAAARAEQPVPLDRQGQITDKVGALGGRKAEVSRALDRLDSERHIQLFVVYVRDFSGRSAQSWADATATRNGLGRDDVLLAVATHDRLYAYSADAAGPFTDARLAEVARTAVEPALRRNDWAGAAIGAADGYAAVLAGRPVPTPALTPGPADPGGTAAAGGAATNLVLPVVVVLAAAGIAAYTFAKRKRRAASRTTPGDGRPGGGWGTGGSGPTPPAEVPLPELDGRARRVLVETDDALRTSQEELGFATAQFGEEAAAPFTDAVAFARGELTVAFRLRQELDDTYPEDDATRRRMLAEIIARCAEADRRLDAESEAFDRLRALERNAPRALDTVTASYQELTGRVARARETLAALRERYADSAAAPVADSADQAADRLTFTATALAEAGRLVAAGDNGRAAVHVRAAESAAGQAATLAEAVERRARELAEAAGRLPGALTETETDLADARGLLKGTAAGVPTADLQGRIGRAEAVVLEVRRESGAGGRYDPIDALRRVEEADAVLDEALTGAREREAGDRRAGTLLDQAMLTAGSAIGAAADYVTTHRGAVGSQARTRLAESQRRLEWARGRAAAGDAQSALGEAQRADALARQAQELAERDVRAYGSRYGSPYGSGPYGGGGGGMGGAVLGGILLGGLFGGRGGAGGGGGYGRGGGGGFGGGGGGPGSFGGGGTRGRMGGGGRF
ncbi:TPM domain-containing protein [Streptomyces sp. NPDC093109]|uniref:TPM domain-containing protein n=1 Tax=Streptomyces sp. NPDC093109 TaxID=3154977 RepID=UPI00344B49F7